MKSTFCQVFPPSFVRYTPRSGPHPNGLPIAATYAMSEFFGWTFTWPIWPTSFSPAYCHVRPASVDLKTPRPRITFDRMASLPVPTYTTSGFDSDTSIAPIDPVGNCPSVTGDHVMP